MFFWLVDLDRRGRLEGLKLFHDFPIVNFRRGNRIVASGSFDTDQPLTPHIPEATPVAGVEPLTDAGPVIFDVVFAQVLFEKIDSIVRQQAFKFKCSDNISAYSRQISIREYESYIVHALATVSLLFPPT